MERSKIGEWIANAVSHGIGFLLSITALIFLLLNAQELQVRLAVLVFGISLMLLYLASTLYHALPHSSPKIVAVFKRLDHSAIYLLIAGTYTPFIILTVSNSSGYWLLIALWSIAVIGITLKSIWINKFHVLHLVMYVLMGWSVMTIWPEVRTIIPNNAMFFLLMGGISYTAGVLFYINKFRYAHFVWHLFVLGGSVFHFISVYFLL